MIKTFKQFTLVNESTKMKPIDFEGEYSNLINSVISYIIEFIDTYGDIEFETPQHLYFLSKKHTIVTEDFISIRVDREKYGQIEGNENGECLVGVTENGQEIPISSRTVPSNTFFIITDYIYSHI